MKISNRLLRQLCTVFSSVLCVSIAGAALAQSYPNKSIRIILPAPPGGGSDFVGRIIGLKLGAAFGQPVIMDNRGGAAGNIAAELVAKAAPDGYTLLLATPSHAINPSLYRKLSYDFVKDFAPITQVTAQAYLFALHPSVPAKTVKEFIALAKSKKGRITYASSGVGQAQHLGMELLKTLAGFDAVHVPYKGAGPATIDLIAGQVDASMMSMPGGLPHVRGGKNDKIRAIAVTSLKRSVLLPDVPTVAEAGFPGYEVSGWFGLLAPAGTPREAVTKLYEEISRSLKLPDVGDRMAAGGADPVGSTPEEFAAYIQAEIIKYEKVITQSGARAD
ncbi:MAG: tripartite tricarboxylate transporter substrate binding protein [Betaproteobacteria bacterium]|nr:tripartite tricarboxylate transporter substrate binding protein [Betaproteobacteria bacterium]